MVTLFEPKPHAMVLTATPWQDVVECDERMAPLLQAFWQLGIVTNWSCEGEPALRMRAIYNFAYVQCPKSRAVDDLLNFLARHELFGTAVSVSGSYESFWTEVFPRRRSVLTSTLVVERDNGAVVGSEPRVCMRIPATLLPQAIEAVQNYSVGKRHE